MGGGRTRGPLADFSCIVFSLLVVLILAVGSESSTSNCVLLQDNCVHRRAHDDRWPSDFIRVQLEAADQKWTVLDSDDVEESCRLLVSRLRNSIVWRFQLSCQFCTLFLANFCRFAGALDISCLYIWHFELFFTRPQSACTANADVSTFVRLVTEVSRRFHQFSALFMSPVPGSAYERLALQVCTHRQITGCVRRMVLSVSPPQSMPTP